MQAQRSSSPGRPSASGRLPFAAPPRQNQRNLTSIAVQPFAAFRARTSSIPTPSPVRRKPVPSDASAAASRFSSAEYPSPRREETKGPQRPYSVNSPPPDVLSPPLTSDRDFVPRDLDRFPHGETPSTGLSEVGSATARFGYRSKPRLSLQTGRSAGIRHSGHGRAASTPQTATRPIAPPQGRSRSPPDSSHTRTPTMTTYTQVRAPDLKLNLNGLTGAKLDDGRPVAESGLGLKPKSPSQKFSSFFGWKSNAQAAAGPQSPSTNFSDSRSVSPASPMLNHDAPGGMGKPSALDIPKANTMAPSNYATVASTPLQSSSAIVVHVEELERELREVSTELANSVRREMELEDEVERWRLEHPGATSENNKRTSDYYSDSGASSSRYLYGESEQKLEELEKARRRAEQEKAQMKADMADKIQEELKRRRDLEAHVQSLEEQLQNRAGAGIAGDGERIREMETVLDNTRRQLSDERQFKENFEDLLGALREELEQQRNERDNLKDEVVPQLQSRIEGLETEASQVQQLLYEKAKMQQELQSLRNENNTLVNARRTALDVQQLSPRFGSIAEEADNGFGARPGLSRSNSLARNSVVTGRRTSLSRSGSLKGRSEPQESVTDRIKDIEEQRDALHKALRSLLDRHELQQKEHQKHIKLLETERDRALNITPRRTTFNKEVTNLREEVNLLRRRADEALEQKWQCEKGLGGLKMDLDRAEQETASLRDLLQDRDVALPDRPGSSGSNATRMLAAVSLDKALGELRTTQALSLARIKDMEAEGAGISETNAEHVLELLKQSISEAEVERDAAQKEAEIYREQARSLQKSEMEHLGKEKTLSSQLYASATRMDELATQVQHQLQSNKLLRNRLAEAIGRGENDQKASAARISELQGKLRSLEDKVMHAQHHSEEVVFSNEEEVRQLKESHNAQLQRAKKGIRSPSALSPSNPASPLLLKSPRLDKTSSGRGRSLLDATRNDYLDSRVADLEKALSDADQEMEAVVGKMNLAQIEVAELQSERDEATRQTRRLQAEILAEREKVKALMS